MPAVSQKNAPSSHRRDGGAKIFVKVHDANTPALTFIVFPRGAKGTFPCGNKVERPYPAGDKEPSVELLKENAPP